MRCWFALLAACGNDVGAVPVDAEGVGGPPGSPSVVVATPLASDSFYPSQTATITWTATDDSPSVTCDVSVSSGAAIASDVTATSGAPTSVSWSLAGTAAGTYRIQVQCTDAMGLTGSGLSAMFRVSTPPQMVAYTQVQAIWTRSCTGAQCHDASSPQGGLELTPSASYAELVNKPGGSCTQYDLVEPGFPERSYLVFKLQGSGPCFMGSRMPKPPDALTAAEIQLVRDWVFNGAPGP